jgi:hypothetical protein
VNRHQRIKRRAEQLGGKASAKAQLAIKPEVGREYLVQGYWTGTFKGRIEWISASEGDPVVRLVVTNAMRRGAAIACDYPECLDEMGHAGDHRFDEDFRNGTIIELAVRNARFVPAVFEEFQSKKDETLESWHQGKHA